MLLAVTFVMAVPISTNGGFMLLESWRYRRQLIGVDIVSRTADAWFNSACSVRHGEAEGDSSPSPDHC